MLTVFSHLMNFVIEYQTVHRCFRLVIVMQFDETFKAMSRNNANVS